MFFNEQVRQKKIKLYFHSIQKNLIQFHRISMQMQIIHQGIDSLNNYIHSQYCACK